MAGFSLLYVWFSRFLFSLAERTRLAFPPQDMAAKRWWQAHFRGSKKRTSEIANLNFFNRAVEIFNQLCREFLKLASRLLHFSIWRKRWQNFA